MRDRALQLVLTFGIALLAVPALAQTTEGSKTNSTPPPAWLRATSAGGNGSTVANAIKVAPNSDQYVTGQFSLKAKFSTTTLVAQGGTDIFLARYEASGKLVWVLQAGGGAEEDAGQALSLDSEGNVYVTGSFDRSQVEKRQRQRPNGFSGKVHLRRPPGMDSNRRLVFRGFELRHRTCHQLQRQHRLPQHAGAGKHHLFL